MCGLIGASSIKNKHTGNHIINLYRKQDKRGKSGFGFLAINKGKLVGIHRSTDEGSIIKLLAKEKADTILFHHRLPTSTKNTLGTTHPIKVSHEELEFDYYFAHNGIISNAKLLKERHNVLGYVYQTEFTEHTVAVYSNGTKETLDEHNTVFNDSESLAIELARYLEGLTERVATAGAAAFWGISLKKGTNEVQEIFFGKNKGRDLGHFVNHKWAGFASESGSDVESMKIFSYEPSEPTKLFERELPIDVAQPVTTMGFHTRAATTTVSVTVPSQRNNVGYHFEPDSHIHQQAYDSLVNTQYSLFEVKNSGMSEDDFFSIGGANAGPNARVWLPYKFAGMTESRIDSLHREILPPFRPNTLLLESNDDIEYTPIQSKEMERLEELVLQYVAIEEEIVQVDAKAAKGAYSEYTRSMKMSDCFARQQRIEDEFATLGLDAEVVEDKLDEARDLMDESFTSNSYLPERDGITVI